MGKEDRDKVTSLFPSSARKSSCVAQAGLELDSDSDLILSDEFSDYRPAPPGLALAFGFL